MSKADLLEAWHGHLTNGRRRSPHTVRAYTVAARRLIEEHAKAGRRVEHIYLATDDVAAEGGPGPRVLR